MWKKFVAIFDISAKTFSAPELKCYVNSSALLLLRDARHHLGDWVQESLI